jgi:hypothetical protein
VQRSVSDISWSFFGGVSAVNPVAYNSPIAYLRTRPKIELTDVFDVTPSVAAVATVQITMDMAPRYFFSKCSHWLWVPPTHRRVRLVQRYISRNTRLTTHLHLAPKLITREAILALPCSLHGVVPNVAQALYIFLLPFYLVIRFLRIVLYAEFVCCFNDI